ncbi:MAG TPA: 50S ribosomal protein L18 [Blattabacteriaceae bacterium]
MKKKSIKNIIRKIFGTAERPRISVFKSNKEIYAQIIDDMKGITLISASSREKCFTSLNGTKVFLAGEVGKGLGEKAKKFGLVKVVFDRNGYKYHGRIKSLAEGAREMGLDF